MKYGGLLFGPRGIILCLRYFQILSVGVHFLGHRMHRLIFISYTSYSKITVIGLDLLELVAITGWAKKTGPFLNVDSFTMVSGRKACDMSKVYKICLEKKCELA